MYVIVIKDFQDRVLDDLQDILQRWKGYFETLLTTENQREAPGHVPPNLNGVGPYSPGEIQARLKRMENGKGIGPDNILIEVWKTLSMEGVKLLTTLFQRIDKVVRIPTEWQKSTLVPIYKQKGDIQQCSNYRGVKLMSHTKKLWERVVDCRVREEVTISEEQLGFMPGRSTTEAIFALRQLYEKYNEKQRPLHSAFVDLEKAYDTVPHDLVWSCLRQKNCPQKYIRAIQVIYEGSPACIRCAVGGADYFPLKVGLHQGSALGPFLFITVMNVLGSEAS